MQTSDNFFSSTMQSGHKTLSSSEMVEVSHALTRSVIAMGISYAHLGRLFAVPATVALRIVRGEFALRKNQHHELLKAQLLIQLHEILASRLKNTASIREWLTSYCPDLGLEPQEFVNTPDGIVQLREYLMTQRPAFNGQ